MDRTTLGQHSAVRAISIDQSPTQQNLKETSRDLAGSEVSAR
jgi:hypothetical protein